MSVAAATLAPAEPVAETVAYEFDDTFQRKIVRLSMLDDQFAVRTEGLIKPEYFANEIDGALISVLGTYYGKYRKAPDKGSLIMVINEAIKDKKMRTYPDLKERMTLLMGTSVSDRDFVIDKVSEFARERAMENAIMESVGLLGKRDYPAIMKRIQAALDVGALDDAGDYDYFDMIHARTEHRIAVAAGTIKPTGVTTGFLDLDKLLYHRGFGRKELTAIMARAKFGKSMALGTFGKAAAMAGHNVFIASCEVSREIYAERLDADFSDTVMSLIRDQPIAVRDKVLAWAARSHGHLKIRDFASGSLKPSQLRRILQQYRNQGIIFDEIIVDYADIMSPERFTGETTVDSKSIWIDLRAIGYEENAAMLTATQTNRTGAAAMMPKPTDVADDYNKIRIADLVIAGTATEEEIAAGEARLNFAASRNQKEMTLTIKQDRAKMKFLTKIMSSSS